MPKLKVHLSIGHPASVHNDIIEVDDEAYRLCETDDERDALCEEHWQEWANNYIDGSYEIEE